MLVQIMNDASLNSKNIMNIVGIFNFSMIVLILIIIPRNNTGMNNVSYEYSYDE